MLTGWQEQLVRECRVARLATIGPDRLPNIVPVCFAYEGGTFAIAIDEKPKRGGKLARIRNIERDPRVTLLVDRYDDDWTRLAWVRIHGRATVAERGSEQPAALRALRDRYPQYREMALEERPLISIVPERIVSWRWNEDDR